MTLRASTAVGSDMVRLTYLYLLSATFWLLIGTAFGLIAALKLNWPDILAVSWLSFGRIRPVHTNTLFWGWSTMALVGLALFVVSRTSRAPLWRPQWSLIALGLWHLAVLLGLFTLAAGVTRGPQEYREWIWPIAVLFGAGLILNGVNIFQTIARRQIDEIYVSNWYILGGFIWTAILFTTGYLTFYQRGLGNTIIQGYYMHNGVGMWFTQLAIGITYYALAAPTQSPHLLLFPGRARLLDQYALLHRDWHAPLHFLAPFPGGCKRPRLCLASA